MIFNIWIKFADNSLDFHILLLKKWCFSNILELIRRALVDVMLACYLSCVFLSVLGFKNMFRRRPILSENFLDFFGLFPIFF